jgi:hypothetical protein
MFRTALTTAATSTALTLAALLCLAAPAHAQSTPGGSLAAETDILSYGLSGYSAIFSGTLPNKLQLAFGIGRYDVPEFLVSADANHEIAQWNAEVTSLQVARATYRFRGAMKSGPALGVVMLNQNWHLRSTPLDGETRFRVLSVGVTGGYYIHVGEHFYLYPTAALTYNGVSGSTSVNGTSYAVERLSPNASLHIGWDWRR